MKYTTLHRSSVCIYIYIYYLYLYLYLFFLFIFIFIYLYLYLHVYIYICYNTTLTLDCMFSFIGVEAHGLASIIAHHTRTLQSWILPDPAVTRKAKGSSFHHITGCEYRCGNSGLALLGGEHHANLNPWANVNRTLQVVLSILPLHTLIVPNQPMTSVAFSSTLAEIAIDHKL